MLLRMAVRTAGKLTLLTAKQLPKRSLSRWRELVLDKPLFLMYSDKIQFIKMMKCKEIDCWRKGVVDVYSPRRYKRTEVRLVFTTFIAGKIRCCG